MSSLTSKPGAPQITNTTQNSAPPPYVQNAQQNLITTGSNLTSPFTSYAPTYMVAGINPDQQMAFDLARQTAYNAYSTPTNFADPISPTANFVTPNMAQAAGTTLPPASTVNNTGLATAQMGPAAQAALAQMGPAAQAALEQATFKPGESEQLRAGEIKEFLNPYLQNVLDPTLANMRRQNDETLAQTRAKSAAAGAFGGSRGALMEAQQNRAFGEQVATTAAQLMAQGYDKATATAMANAQMRQKTALQNTQLGTQVGLANAQMGNQSNQFNAGQQNQVGMFNTGQANQVGIWNAGAQNQARMFDTGQANDQYRYNQGQQNQLDMFNAGQGNDMSKYGAGLAQQLGMYNTGQQNDLAKAFGLNYNNLLDSEANRNLTTAATNNTLANDDQRRQLAALQQMLQTGDYQRQVEQASINSPFTALQSLVGSTPGMNAVGTTTNGATAAPTTSNPLASILGISLLGKTLLGASDEKLKTNKEKLGTDPNTGVPIYAYDYKADVEKAKRDGTAMPPKRVGPMAQDVEQVMPDAVGKIGGKRVVKMSALQALTGAAS